jgi:hypothetical protein
LLIGVATLRHSAYGFASIESGNFWLGLLSALAVDVLMILFAHGLRDGFRWDYAAGLAIPSLLSIYTQLLFAVSESQAMIVAPGAEWLGGAQDILRWRVVFLPAALPILALVASLAGRGEIKHIPLAVHEALLVELEKVKAGRMEWTEKANTEIEKLRKAAQSQQGVVGGLQAQVEALKRGLAEAERTIEVAGVVGKLSKANQAKIVNVMLPDGGDFRTAADMAKYFGLDATAISKAKKAHRENGKELRAERQRQASKHF